MRSSLLLLFLLVVVSCAGVPRRDTLQMPYEDRLKLASIYIQAGEADRAVPLLEDAVIQDEARPEAWAMLGELFWMKGDLASSSKHLEKALAKGGEDAVILNNLAWVESEMGRHGRALVFADRAIAMDPVPLYPYLETRARILIQLGRYEEAEADARAAMGLTPEYEAEMREGLQELLREAGDRKRLGEEDKY